MCIIMIKKIGLELPKKEIFKTMFENNPDGAGFMYNDIRKNHVVIKKGFMNFDSFYDAICNIPDSKNKTVITHCRISTHGNISPENTHPFPITNKKKELMLLNNTTNLSIVHNGCIPIKVSDNTISDTMEYIKTKLFKKYKKNSRFYYDKYTLDDIKDEIQSKMCFLLPSGEYILVNEEKFIEDNGYIYSNSSYIPYTYKNESSSDNYYEWIDINDGIMCANLLEPDSYISVDGYKVFGCDEDIFISENDEVYIYDENYFPMKLNAIAYDHRDNRVRFDATTNIYYI